MKFKDLPVEVQVAIITTAGALATSKLQSQGNMYSSERNFFKVEYTRIMNELYAPEE